MRGQEAGPLTVAAVIASSELASHARLAVHSADGTFQATGAPNSLGGVWETSGIGFGSPQDDRAPWIQWDLGAVCRVSRMEVWNFPESSPAIKRGQLEVSTDGQSYAVFQEISLGGYAGPEAPDRLDFSSLTARFIRLRVQEIHGGDVYPLEPGTPIKGFAGFAGLTEVRFVGSTLPPLPTITGHPQAQEVELDVPVTLRVTLSSVAGVTFQWLRNGKELPGRTLDTLELPHAQFSDAGEYQVRISNGAEAQLSNPAMLTVKPGARVADDFNDNVKHPSLWAGSDVGEGAALVQETNQRLEYRVAVPAAGGFDEAYRPLAELIPVPGDQNWEATVDVHNTSVPGNGKWAAVGMSLFHPEADRGVFLELYALGAQRGIITGLDADGEPVGVDGDTGNLGATTASIRLVFQAQTRVLSAFHDPDGVANGQQWRFLAAYGLGGTGGSHGNENWDLNAGDKFQLALGGYSESTAVSSGAAYLDNFVLVTGGTAVPPLVQTSPGNVAVPAGQAVQFTVVANGAGALGYRWRKGGVPLLNGGSISGADSATLVLADVQAADGGSYDVVVHNLAGAVVSGAAMLSVLPAAVAPAVVQQPDSVTLVPGATASFTAGVTGTPVPSLRWQRATEAGNGWSDLVDGAGITGSGSGTLVLNSVTAEMNGQRFRLAVSNSAGSVFTVPVSVSTLSAPLAGGVLLETFYDIPGWQTRDLTNASKFPAAPDATTILAEAFATSAQLGTNFGRRAQALLIPPVTGDYTFWIASDDQGDLFLSTDATPANRRLLGHVPLWTSELEWNKFPGQESPPVSLVAGNAYYLEALTKEEEQGDHLAVGWRLPDGTMERPIPVAVNGQVRLTPFGLKELASPQIVQHPANAAVAAGQGAQFSVTATGTAPLTYRWRKGGVNLSNGGNLSGADSATLVLANLQATDAGSYDVVVGNAAGSRTSDPAVLTVETSAIPQKIPGITATATSELASHGRVAANAVNGIYQDSSFWESVGTVEGFGEDRDPAITFDLQSPRRLDHFLIWNSHEPGPAIKRLFVEVSLDGVSFTRLPGEFALVSNLALEPQKVSLGGATARFVRFDILENYAGVTFPVVGNPPGWSLVAIDEVEFYGTATGPAGLPVADFLEWYRADSAQFAGLADGDPIVNWLPETGSSATPAPGQVAGQEIRYRPSVAELNGQPALEFPGGPSLINNIAKVDFNGVSLFLVFRNIGSGGLQRAVAGLDSNTLLGPWNPSQAGRYNPTIHLGGVWKIHPEDVVGWSDPGTCVLSVVMDDVATEHSFINGVELDSTKGGAGPMDTTGIGRLSFGGGAVGEPYKGYIAEFIVYRRVLAAAETAAVHDYLLTKYGLKGTTVTAPEITGQPAGITVPPGGTAQFTVTATGTAPLRYQWRKGGSALSNGGNVSGTDTATLVLTNVQTTEAGAYDVVVSNAAGADTSEAAVLLVEDTSQPQKITGITATATSELASHGRLAANAVNGVYLDGYFWESVGVGQGFGEDRDPAITFDLQSAYRLDHLLIWNSHERDPAIKRLRLELSVDGANFTAVPGEFTLQAILDPQKLALGGRLARFVRLDILENYAGVTFPVTGTTGGWSLVAIDEIEFFGQLNDQTPLAPTITQEPQSLTVTAGQASEFSVKAAGSAPLNYQWRRGGNALVDGGGISGATTARLTLAKVALDAAGSYDVVVGNAVGTVTSATVTLTVNPAPAAPAIVQQPANATAVPGQAATFSVTAVGTAPLSYQWFHTAVAGGAEVPVTGATAAILSLGNVTTANAGTYRVRVSNPVNPGGVFSQPAALTVVLLERGFVTRVLPGAYVPGQAFGVVLEAKPATGATFYAVFDQPPAGWTVSGINEGGTFDAQTGRVKFGPFADNAARTLRYTVLPPPNASDRQEFSGIASADGVDGDIRGNSLIETSLDHPADLNGDRQLIITEITGYGAAWKQGATWSLPPNPLPVNYVTRAGFLWRNGERYRFDPAAGAAPLWWLPETAAGPTRRVARQALNTASSATRSFTGNEVKLAVAPADAVSVHAVEERLFAGFKATDISHGGVFLPEQGLVRWGPFFDHQSRELTYTVTPPVNFEGEIAVLGLLSVDGESFPASGDSVLRFGTAELPPPVTPDLSGDSFKLEVSGPLNARVVIETSESLGGGWTVATEFELNKPDQSWSVPLEIQESGKFFRVRVIVP